jgi:hypothetical protein
MKWRTNPKTSGPTFVLGDIGTHIYYMSEVVLPHMKIKKLLCDRQSFIKTRAPLEDNDPESTDRAVVVVRQHVGISEIALGNIGTHATSWSISSDRRSI